jgi:hypothetical protein
LGTFIMTPPRAATVRDYVDPHSRRLVDAINRSPFGARTAFCCSGHYHKESTPYLSFHSRSWDFIRFLLTAITGLNRITRGNTRLQLTSYIDEREISGSIRWSVYPWLYRGACLLPLFTEEVIPPRTLVQLWWWELDELGAMVEQHRAWPSREFVARFDEQLRRSFDGRRKHLPAWARNK